MQPACKANYQSVPVDNVLPELSWGEQNLSDESTENTYIEFEICCMLDMQHSLGHAGVRLHSCLHRLDTKAFTACCSHSES